MNAALLLLGGAAPDATTTTTTTNGDTTSYSRRPHHRCSRWRIVKRRDVTFAVAVDAADVRAAVEEPVWLRHDTAVQARRGKERRLWRRWRSATFCAFMVEMSLMVLVLEVVVVERALENPSPRRMRRPNLLCRMGGPRAGTSHGGSSSCPTLVLTRQRIERATELSAAAAWG
jgi:hypothetical protein